MQTNKLVEALREHVGKSSYQMRGFFQGMVNRGELKAYLVEVDKQIVEKDTEGELIYRIIKGATLVPTSELKEYGAALVEYLEIGTIYNLDIGSHGGMFYNDGDSQTMYHHCVLERLIKSFDPKKVKTRTSFGELISLENGIRIPEEMVEARLRVNYDEDWEYGGTSDFVDSVNASLVIEGEKDKLFEKVCDFVRGK